MTISMVSAYERHTNLMFQGQVINIYICLSFILSPSASEFHYPNSRLLGCHFEILREQVFSNQGICPNLIKGLVLRKYLIRLIKEFGPRPPSHYVS